MNTINNLKIWKYKKFQKFMEINNPYKMGKQKNLKTRINLFFNRIQSF